MSVENLPCGPEEYNSLEKFTTAYPKIYERPERFHRILLPCSNPEDSDEGMEFFLNSPTIVVDPETWEEIEDVPSIIVFGRKEPMQVENGMKIIPIEDGKNQKYATFEMKLKPGRMYARPSHNVSEYLTRCVEKITFFVHTRAK